MYPLIIYTLAPSVLPLDWSTPQPSPVLTIITPIIHMSTTFTSVFSNEARAEGSRSVRAARGSGRHRSMFDHVQSRAARRAAARREITPFDFNVGRYHVSSFFRYHVVAARLILNI